MLRIGPWETSSYSGWKRCSERHVLLRGGVNENPDRVHCCILYRRRFQVDRSSIFGSASDRRRAPHRGDEHWLCFSRPFSEAQSIAFSNCLSNERYKGWPRYKRPHRGLLVSSVYSSSYGSPLTPVAGSIQVATRNQFPRSVFEFPAEPPRSALSTICRITSIHWLASRMPKTGGSSGPGTSMRRWL